MLAVIYLILHIPAFILLFVGLGLRIENPERSKILLILAGIYFVIGGGICGYLVTGLGSI